MLASIRSSFLRKATMVFIHIKRFQHRNAVGELPGELGELIEYSLHGLVGINRRNSGNPGDKFMAQQHYNVLSSEILDDDMESRFADVSKRSVEELIRERLALFIKTTSIMESSSVAPSHDVVPLSALAIPWVDLWKAHLPLALLIDDLRHMKIVEQGQQEAFVLGINGLPGSG